MAVSTWLHLIKLEGLRGLGNRISKDRSKLCGDDPLIERGVEKGSDEQSTLLSRKWSVFSGTGVGAVLTAPSGRLSRDRACGAQH